MSHKAIFVQPGGGYERVIVGTSEAARPEAGEITVRLRANSLNYHDFAVVSGMWGPSEPRIPMADGAGEVVAVGSGVTEFAVGDAVVSTFFPDWLAGEPLAEGFATVPGDGVDGYAREMVTARATSFTHAPKGYRLAVALQFAKMAGATVIATSSSDAKLERLREMGADHLINYRTTPAWGETVRELTDGRGVDHVIEVGGPATLAQSMVAARIGGHISVIGILTGIAGELQLVPALVRQLRLQGVLVGSRTQQQEMIRAIDANGIRPVIDKRFALDEIVEAFRYQESNQHFGKICLEF